MPDHRIHLARTLALPALVEWVSLLIGGLVIGQRVESEQFVVEVSAAQESNCAVLDLTSVDALYWERGRSTSYPLGEYEGLAPLYTLCLGLFQAGTDVRLESPWATYIPRHGRLIHDEAAECFPAGGLTLPFFALGEKHEPLDPAQLAEIHGALAGAKSFAECFARAEFRHAFADDQVDPGVASEFVLQQRTGLRVRVAMTSEQEILSHQIIEQEMSPENLVTLRPRSIDCRFDKPLEPVHARTFGEAVIGLAPKGYDSPTSAAVLFEEVAVIKGNYFHRFQIEDRRTLDTFAMLPLGEGCSKLYPAPRWADAAQAFEWRHQWELAAACWEQARRLGGTPDEVAHYELQLEYCEQQPAREAAEAEATAERERRFQAEVTVRKISDYIAQLPPDLGDNFRAAVEQINDRRQFCEDNKLSDTDLAWTMRGEGERRVELAWFDMPLVWLLEAGVPRASIEYRGDFTLSDPINPKTLYRRWMEIRSGTHCLWTDVRGWHINPDEPAILYYG